MLTSPQTLRAIAMMCLAALSYTLNDTVTKFLIDDYNVTVIVLIRSLLAMPLLVFMALVLGRQRVRWSKKIVFHAIRGAVGLLAAYFYIRGLEYLSVAEATVIVFASPFITTAAAALLFGEPVGWRKWVSVLISFGGVIIALRPGAATFQPASLFILAASFLYAANSLTSRWLPREDSLWTVSFFGAAFSALFVSPFAVSDWAFPEVGDLFLFAGAALCSSFGIGLSALAYRSASASDLTPFGYSGLIWSIGVTWIVWGTVPAAWTIIGACVIAGSVLFHFLSTKRIETRIA